ncbi:MAG: hypothetical protein NVV74_24135 [Magnetospirillum sp.]|nr:hypothetical protein [Magnetospirillum sp.]
MPARLPLLAAALLAAGCSTVIDGTRQTIRVNSDPARAACVLTRDAQIIAETVTPGRVEVEKDKRDIQMVCSAEGYEDKLLTLRSGLAPAAFANIVGTAGIGWAVDSLTGADNSYPEVVTVILRKPRPKPAGAAP